jgi:hypothetical protein
VASSVRFARITRSRRVRLGTRWSRVIEVMVVFLHTAAGSGVPAYGCCYEIKRPTWSS